MNSNIDIVKENVKQSELVFESIKKNFRLGFTEKNIYEILKSVYGKEFTFKCDIVSGSRSIDIGGEPTEKTIKVGDTLIIDLMAKRNGYYSDTTRTFIVGEKTKLQDDVYKAIKTVLINTSKFVKSGMYGEDVHKFAFNELKKYNLEIYFPHHAGHKVGKESCEKPDFLPNEKMKIEENMIIAIEIGVYIPGKFGMRIEDNFIVKKNDIEKIGEYTLDIKNFIL